jgi:hypothetical protein
MANKNSVSNYEQQLYLSGVLLSGVTSIDGNCAISESPINIIGKGFVYPIRQQPLVGNFTIDKYFIGEDILLNYTGDNHMNGSIHYGDKSFGFESGYLTEYSFSANIGSIPTVRASIDAYGNIGSGINASGNLLHPQVEIANQGSISMNVAGHETNRITDFSYNLRIDRSPVYVIGSPFPVQVDRVFPIVQEASFTMEVDDYEIKSFSDFLSSPEQQGITFSIKNPINNREIQEFKIPKARLVNTSLVSSSEDLMTISLSYIGHTNKK